ncbi:hypothetical protein SAY86_031248 [Trapa natans]|nr:hypothetical protein SAY86_031248 [Trapa natans]
MSLLSCAPCKSPRSSCFNNGYRPINSFSILCKITLSSHRLPRCSSSSQPGFKANSAVFKSAPLATASLAVLLWSSPVHAGILSGFSGIESIPGPELPQLDFLTKFNEENQKKYAEADARFKESPLLKQLLEKSKQNKEKNRQEILDKYCLRGAEWGVGDCSTDGMSAEDRESFISMLKQKTGAK